VRQRPLGKTGKIVSELALGTWGLSGEPYGPVDERDAEAVITSALDMGITLFDTSDSYGGGKMEALLGRVCKGKSDVVLVTKGGTDRRIEPPVKRFDEEHLRGSVERSLKRLGVEAIPVYLLHCPTRDALVDDGERKGALSILKALQREGKIEHIGVSCGGEDVLEQAIEEGAEVVEVAYNIFHSGPLTRKTGDIMVRRPGVLARSVLNYGVLAGHWTRDREFPDTDHRSQRWTKMELEHRVDQLDALQFLVKGDVRTLRGAAVRFVLASHVVTCAVLGPRTVEQLEQLVRETGGGPRYLKDDDLVQLYRELEKVGVHV